jgi:hypothetical protein
MTEGKVNSQRNNKQSLSMGKTLPTERKTAGPPPKKAVEAAVMAMSKAGYQVRLVSCRVTGPCLNILPVSHHTFFIFH